MPATAPPLRRAVSRRRLCCQAVLAALLLAASARALEPPLPGRVWYVDNTAPEGGDGSLVAPFRRLARAEHASDAGDTIYVFRGDGTDRWLDRGIQLKPHQRLIGGGVAFTPDGEEPLASGEAPVLSAPAGPVVTLASHSQVAGVHLRGGGSVALLGRGTGAVRLADLTIDGGGVLDVGIALEGSDGAVLENLDILGTRDHGIRLDRCAHVQLRHAVLSANGDADGDAALLVSEPGGRYEVVGLEIDVRGGRSVAVEATTGTATLALEGATFAGDLESALATTGLAIATRGDARLTVRLGSAVVQSSRRRGIEVHAAGTSKLDLVIEGSGFVGTAGSAEGLAVHAGDGAELDMTLAGNDILGTDVGVLVTATGEARLQLVFSDNALPAASRGRGIAIVLGDAAQAAGELVGNELSGQLAEAIFLRTGATSRLSVDLRDNVVAEAAATASAPRSSVLLESREGSRLCASLSNNRIGEGPGGGPALLVRQLDTSLLSLAGHERAAALTATGVAADNRLGRVEIEGAARPAQAGVTPCPPAPTPPTSAAGDR